MSLSSQLAAVKLKKVELNESEASNRKSEMEQQKPTKLICETTEDYDKLIEETYFETYYDAIKHLTFPSIGFELSKTEIRALLADNEDAKDDDEEEGEDEEAQANNARREASQLSWAEKDDCLSLLAAKIDEKIASLRW